MSKGRRTQLVSEKPAKQRKGHTVLDRKDLRTRGCWWVSHCVHFREVCADCEEEFAYWDTGEKWGKLCFRCLERREDTEKGMKYDASGMMLEPLGEDDVPIPLRKHHTPAKISTEKVLREGLRRYVVEVSIKEAKETGEGRECPMCGRKSGSYICDGFPTHAATTILTADGEESPG